MEGLAHQRPDLLGSLAGDRRDMAACIESPGAHPIRAGNCAALERGSKVIFEPLRNAERHRPHNEFLVRDIGPSFHQPCLGHCIFIYILGPVGLVVEVGLSSDQVAVLVHNQIAEKPVAVRGEDRCVLWEKPQAILGGFFPCIGHEHSEKIPDATEFEGLHLVGLAGRHGFSKFLFEHLPAGLAGLVVVLQLEVLPQGQLGEAVAMAEVAGRGADTFLGQFAAKSKAIQ